MKHNLDILSFLRIFDNRKLSFLRTIFGHSRFSQNCDWTSFVFSRYSRPSCCDGISIFCHAGFSRCLLLFGPLMLVFWYFNHYDGCIISITLASQHGHYGILIIVLAFKRILILFGYIYSGWSLYSQGFWKLQLSYYL